jgi:hypothetical protein
MLSKYDGVEVTPTPDEFNVECIRDLEAAKLTERVVVVGSGPSSPFITSIEELINRLERQCRKRTKEGEYHWDFCDRARTANPKKYYQTIKQTFENLPAWTADVYRHLVKINFKGYVTLNYDDQLPKEFRAQHGNDSSDRFSVYPHADGSSNGTARAIEFHKPSPSLVAIHGYCDPGNRNWHKQVILSGDDYHRHYFSKETSQFLFHWWSELLTSRSCIFIGTSLREPGLLRVVEELKKDLMPRLVDLDHIHLVGTDDVAEVAQAKSLGVFRKTRYHRKDARFSGLSSVLSHFSRLPTDTPRPAAPVQREIGVINEKDFQ